MSARLPVTQIKVGPHKSTKAQAQVDPSCHQRINITTHSPIQPNPAHCTTPESGQSLSSCTIYTRVIPLSFRMVQSDRTPPQSGRHMMQHDEGVHQVERARITSASLRTPPVLHHRQLLGCANSTEYCHQQMCCIWEILPHHLHKSKPRNTVQIIATRYARTASSP
jgi:hypothetical protein